MNFEFAQLDVRCRKPGRCLTAFDLEKVVGWLGKTVQWVYLNRLEPGVIAGNHFHYHKTELIMCVSGIVKIGILDPATGEHHDDVFNGSANPRGVIWRPGIGHAVQNIGQGMATVLVFATGEPRGEDDIECVIF